MLNRFIAAIAAPVMLSAAAVLSAGFITDSRVFKTLSDVNITAEAADISQKNISNDSPDEDDMWDYEEFDDGTINLYLYKGEPADELVIPRKIDGKIVSRLGNSLIPEYVKSVSIPGGVIDIDSFAFWKCKNLTDISVAELNSAYCSIDGVLYDRKKTNIIKYPAAKQETKYTVPDGVTGIGWRAFSDCVNLKLLEIGEEVTDISVGAFINCMSIENIDVSPGNSVYCSEDGILFNKSKKAILRYPAGKTNESYKIANGVESLNDYVFSGCRNLKNINIPDSVTSLGCEAFSDCTGIGEIILPNNILSCSLPVFSGCTNLKSINTADGNSDLSFFSSSDGILFNRDKSEIIKYPEGRTDSGYTIPKGVKIIGINSFSNCVNLENIIIPDSVEEIGWGAFSGCISLTGIKIPRSVLYISGSAFSDCVNIKNVTVPYGVKKIEDETFFVCTNLSGITFENPKCEIDGSEYAICNRVDEEYNFYFDGTIYGYDDSTAQYYSEKMGFKFESLGKTAVPGDISGNGKIDFYDVIEIAESLIGKRKFTEAEKKTADFNDDGLVDLYDAIFVAKYILKQ